MGFHETSERKMRSLVPLNDEVERKLRGIFLNYFAQPTFSQRQTSGERSEREDPLQ